ncbi:MAG: hypothetical protein ACLTYN_11590 [Dysosmobacter welbionis]
MPASSHPGLYRGEDAQVALRQVRRCQPGLGTQMKATGEVMAIAPASRWPCSRLSGRGDHGHLNRKPDHGDDAPIRERLRQWTITGSSRCSRR